MAGIEERDWRRISKDLLFSIVKLLPARIDILRLRAVCRSFRATIPLPPIQYPFPHSILTTTDFLRGPDPDEINDLNLTASTVYAIEPLNRIPNSQGEETPQTWVIQVNESIPDRVRIIDPMTSKSCYNVSEKLPKSLNLLDYRVKEIGKCYRLDSSDPWLDFRKLVFSSFHDEHGDEFAVVAIYDHLMKLGMWRNVDQKWSHIDIELLSEDEYFEDIIYYNDRFCALLPKGRTVTVDPKSLTITEVAADLPFNRRYSRLNLVGSFNDLIMAGEYYNDNEDKYYIEVFKLNEKKRKWVQVVDGLDLLDRVLFVGSFWSFSVSVKEFPVFKGGCVYYSASLAGDYPAVDFWIWDSNDDALWHTSDFPGYLNIFWPPPAWLNSREELTVSAGEEKQRSSSGDNCDNCERKILR